MGNENGIMPKINGFNKAVYVCRDKAMANPPQPASKSRFQADAERTLAPLRPRHIAADATVLIKQNGLPTAPLQLSLTDGNAHAVFAVALCLCTKCRDAAILPDAVMC